MFAIDGCKIKSNDSKEWSGTIEELTGKEAKLRRASQQILARHQDQGALSDDEVSHDIKQKAKLDSGATKIGLFLASNQGKIDRRGKPVKVILPTQTVRK